MNSLESSAYRLLWRVTVKMSKFAFVYNGSTREFIRVILVLYARCIYAMTDM